ncbi:MAG: RNA methyltransferase [Chitinophagales bacterium]|nr:RNA methyltransferase [Chitinophagales bacterium]
MTPERFEKIQRVVKNRRFDITVVLENVHDPHNIAAVLRTCDAVGISEVYTIDSVKRLSGRLGKKSSSSASKWVKVHHFDDMQVAVETIRSKYDRMVCTHLNSEAVSIYDMDFKWSIALVFGNEHAGVTDELRALCDGNFIIPQIGMISSLNISVACAVTIYEAFRQRSSINYDEKFTAEKKNLWEDWASRETLS